MVYWNELPNELLILIFTYLDIFTIRKYYEIGKKFFRNSILNEIKFKNKVFLKQILMNQISGKVINKVIKINGFYNNLFHKCFFCPQKLDNNFYIVFCQNIALKYLDNVHYPELCKYCSGKKIKQGVINLVKCKCCNKKVQILEINLY